MLTIYRDRREAPCLYLMSSAPFNEIQLTLTEERDTGIDLVGRRMLPVRGYAKRLFSSIPETRGSSTCLGVSAQRDLSQFAAASAIVRASRLYDHLRRHSQNETMHHKSFLASNPYCIEEAAELILDDYFKMDHIQYMARIMESRGITKIPPPASLSGSDGSELPLAEWYRISYHVFQLCCLILAFAAVGDLQVCEDLLISDILLQDSANFPQAIVDDEGRCVITAHGWYDAMSYLVQGQSTEAEQDSRTCEFWRF